MSSFSSDAGPRRVGGVSDALDDDDLQLARAVLLAVRRGLKVLGAIRGQATTFSKLGNSMTMKRWNFSGPSRILNLPPRARPPNFRRMPGTRSVYSLY